MTGEAGRNESERAPSSTWTLWSAAYAYAAVMRDIAMTRHEPGGDNADFWDVPTMLVAYALAAYADEEAITVTCPADLADLSATTLHDRLHSIRLLIGLSTVSLSNRAVIPAPGEPAHEPFFRMKAEIDAFNAGGPAAVLADEDRMAMARSGEPAWYERGEDAQGLVALMLVTCADTADRQGDVPLRVIADQVGGAAPDGKPARDQDPGSRSYELSEYMAAEEPWPPRDTPQWAVRVMQGVLGGQIFLLHYLASINDRHIDIPDHLVGPRRAGEPAETVAQREGLAKLISETRVLEADWTPQVEDELLHIRPSDAQNAVTAITEIAQQWWVAAGYDGTIDELLPAMSVLLDALVAPERRGEVDDALMVVVYGGSLPFDRARHRIMGTARERPFEAMHLAAAFAGALYQVPVCVPDPNVEYRRLAQAALRLAEGKLDPPRAASTPPPQPGSSARQADARRKARKASRKARRRRRL